MGGRLHSSINVMRTIGILLTAVALRVLDRRRPGRSCAGSAASRVSAARSASSVAGLHSAACRLHRWIGLGGSGLGGTDLRVPAAYRRRACHHSKARRRGRCGRCDRRARNYRRPSPARRRSIPQFPDGSVTNTVSRTAIRCSLPVGAAAGQVGTVARQARTPSAQLLASAAGERRFVPREVVIGLASESPRARSTISRAGIGWRPSRRKRSR